MGAAVWLVLRTAAVCDAWDIGVRLLWHIGARVTWDTGARVRGTMGAPVRGTMGARDTKHHGLLAVLPLRL
jgi:hypothetical protein